MKSVAASKRTDAQGLWLRGDDTVASTPEGTSLPMLPGPVPSWNASPICVQMLHDELVKQGWQAGPDAHLAWDNTVDACPLPKRSKAGTPLEVEENRLLVRVHS